MLDTFATPMKRKRDEVAQTPSSVRGVNSTPQFLRRTNILFSKRLDPVQETAEDVIAKTQPPFKKRSLVRSLSSIIKGLKAQEEDKADEDLELLREMEGDPFEPVPRAQMQRRPETESQKQAERVPETQVEMPLGPDMLPVSDGELSDKDLVGSLDANGQPRKVWKKKGLKRQTKQVKSKLHILIHFTISTKMKQCDLPLDRRRQTTDLPRILWTLVLSKTTSPTKSFLPTEATLTLAIL